MARQRDRTGDYRLGCAEQLDFEASSFDLAVSYITLIDIPDFRTAIREMARVLKPGGSLLMANLTGFTSACGDRGWVKDDSGEYLYYPVDNYLGEFPLWLQWSGIRIQNWHRPLETYMTLLLGQGLELRHFAEPAPYAGNPLRIARYRRAPWFLIMEWEKPKP